MRFIPDGADELANAARCRVGLAWFSHVCLVIPLRGSSFSRDVVARRAHQDDEILALVRNDVATDAGGSRNWAGRFVNAELLITELDVHDATVPGDIATRDAQVAALRRAFLDMTLSYRQVNVLMCWGLTDNLSWLQGRTPRADGQPKRPAPYDGQYQPKPLREAIATALRSAPQRKPT